MQFDLHEDEDDMDAVGATGAIIPQPLPPGYESVLTNQSSSKEP